MSVKKIIWVLLSVFLVFVFGFAVFVGYIYKQDFGVPYKGRARLDYNWKYYFAERPDRQVVYDARLFSFSYPGFKGKGQLNAQEDSNGGCISDGYLLDVFWYKHVDTGIAKELAYHLSSSGGAASAKLSSGLVAWLAGNASGKDFVFKKVPLGKNGTGLLIAEPNGKHDYLVCLLPGGEVVKVVSLNPIIMSEDSYRELAFRPFMPGRIYPSPERDAQARHVMAMFMRTFEVKSRGI